MSEEKNDQSNPPSHIPHQEGSHPGASTEDAHRRGPSFGVLAAVLGVVVIAAAVALLLRPGGAPRGGDLPEDVVAMVGEEEIPLVQFESWVASLPQSVQIQLLREEAKSEILNRFLDRLVLLKYAEQTGVTETDEFKKEAEQRREELAVRLLVQELLREAMDPEKLRAFWDVNRDRFPRPFDDQAQRPRLIQAYQQATIEEIADRYLKAGETIYAESAEDPVIAQVTVEGADPLVVTRKEFTEYAAQLSEQDQIEAATEEGRNELLHRLLQKESLIRVAKERGYMTRPEVEDQLRTLWPHIGALVLAQKAVGDVDAAVEKEITENRTVYEWRSRDLAHILVRVTADASEGQVADKREEAEEIYRKLEGGADFKKLAGESSEDPGSAKSGGVLGAVREDQLVRPFAEAAFALETGSYSKPVRTMFGFHIIKALSDVETNFDEDTARLMARRNLLEARMDEITQKAREEVGVVVNEPRLAEWGPGMGQQGRPQHQGVPPELMKQIEEAARQQQAGEQQGQ